MTFVRIAQPPVVEQERWVSALRVLGQLYLCPDIKSQTIPSKLSLDPLTAFLADIVEGKITGIVFDPGQKEQLESMLSFLNRCEKVEEEYVYVGQEGELPEALHLGEQALNQLHAKHISLQGIFQRAVRQAEPRFDSIALALALLKNLSDFSQANCEALLRAQVAASQLIECSDLTLQIGKEDLTKPWHKALKTLRDMPLKSPYFGAKVSNPLNRYQVVDIEWVFEKVAALNEGALSTALRRVRGQVIEITTICLGILVTQLAELPVRVVVATVKFYFTLPFKVAYLVRNILISK